MEGLIRLMRSYHQDFPNSDWCKDWKAIVQGGRLLLKFESVTISCVGEKYIVYVNDRRLAILGLDGVVELLRGMEDANVCKIDDTTDIDSPTLLQEEVTKLLSIDYARKNNGERPSFDWFKKSGERSCIDDGTERAISSD